MCFERDSSERLGPDLITVVKREDKSGPPERSSGLHERDILNGSLLTMLEVVGKDPKREHLRSAKRIVWAQTIRHAAGQLDDLDEPASIVFLFELVPQPHDASVSDASVSPAERRRFTSPG